MLCIWTFKLSFRGIKIIYRTKLYKSFLRLRFLEDTYANFVQFFVLSVAYMRKFIFCFCFLSKRRSKRVVSLSCWRVPLTYVPWIRSLPIPVTLITLSPLLHYSISYFRKTPGKIKSPWKLYLLYLVCYVLVRIKINPVNNVNLIETELVKFLVRLVMLRAFEFLL